jgi:hypothetical protein
MGIGNPDTLKGKFIENKIDGKRLLKLGREDIKDLGITLVADIQQIQRAISLETRYFSFHLSLGTKKRSRGEEKEESSKEASLTKLDINRYFDDMKPRNEFRLLYTLGSDWLFVGRDDLVLKFQDQLMKRFRVFNTDQQLDKKLNVIPFTSTMKGAGKSKSNQEILLSLKKMISLTKNKTQEDLAFEDMVNHSVRLLVSFTNGTPMVDSEETQSVETKLSLRIFYSYFIHQKDRVIKDNFYNFVTDLSEYCENYSPSPLCTSICICTKSRFLLSTS